MPTASKSSAERAVSESLRRATTSRMIAAAHNDHAAP
jgi:hypothetical protein